MDNFQDRIAFAYELALSGLRQGKSVVSEDIMELLLNGKFKNPMLGIVGAHALLHSRRGIFRLFDLAVSNLGRLIPDHPDLAALKLIRKQVKNDPSQTRIRPLSWPPVLFESYRGVISRDWYEEDLVVPASMADLMAARLIQQAPWTAWTAIETTRELSPKASMTKSFAASRTYTSVPKSAIPVAQEGPAIQRVANHLDLLEKVDGAGQPLVNQLSRQVGLPVTTVRRGLGALGRKL